MDQTGPSIWQVSDGRAGNANQVRAIVAALRAPQRWARLSHIVGEAHREEAITLSLRAPWTWLPGARWPFALAALPADQRALFQPPWPTLWIAAGRRSAPYSRWIKRKSKGATFTIHMLDPKCDPADFDLVITPEHDGLSGPNVVSTIGSPSHFSAEAIAKARADFAPLAETPQKTAIVILGGDSKTHTFTNDAATALLGYLEGALRGGWGLKMSASRRTPAAIVQRFRTFAEAHNAAFWAGAKDGLNPYLGWLLHADAAVVTEDSANMLCDAAWHGLPIHIAKLEGQAPKFDHLHQSLINRGCAKWLNDPLSVWNYTPLREAERVADVIVERLLERFPT